MKMMVTRPRFPRHTVFTLQFIKHNSSGQICLRGNDAFYNLFSAKYEIEIQEMLCMWVGTL